MQDSIITTTTPLSSEEFLHQLRTYFDVKNVISSRLEIEDSTIRLQGKEKMYEWICGASSLEPSLEAPVVMLDPGHIGGDVCDMRKIINGHGELQEGNLTLPTALLVKQQLEKQNIKTLLTRDSYSPVTEKREEEFEDEAKRHLSLTGALELPPFIRKQFPNDLDYMRTWLWNRDDLYKRATLLNSTKKSLSVSIHYLGALGSEYTSANGICNFVKGNHLPEELISESQQVYCLNQIAEGNFLKTVTLGRHIFRNMKDALSLGSPSEEFIPNSVRVEEGIYSRNLVLTREVSGLFVYVERLFQLWNHQIKTQVT